MRLETGGLSRRDGRIEPASLRRHGAVLDGPEDQDA
jgi:hypothetical protein